MKILLVYPETPYTFWSFRAALKFISKKSSEPPLGLITIAAMLPEEWEKKLVDMNVSQLRNEDIKWADYIFISGMNIQKKSFMEVIKKSNELGTSVVAGGPMVTTDHREFLGVDHFILNEAEITLPLFLKDLENGHAQLVYASDEFPDLDQTPTPLWHLLDQDKYGSMSIQYSRGCPFDCEFCSITMLNGHRPRTKNTNQFLDELAALRDSGWTGGVLIVDDNFIGNKIKLKRDFLPALKNWLQENKYPFGFSTEASINLADDEELMQLMVEAGFDHTFIGIETPNTESLVECGKKQNLKRNLVSSVKKLHQSGLRVSGGFIVGFDHDPGDIFEQQIEFIRNSGIVTAMVGLLNAPMGTRLFRRLKDENRLLNTVSGDNMDGTINFIPKMNYQKLISGYKRLLETIYSPKEYYERVKTFLREFDPRIRECRRIKFVDIKALFRSIWILGILDNGKKYYWRLFFLSLFKYPKKFPMAITLAVYGFHFRQVVRSI